MSTEPLPLLSVLPRQSFSLLAALPTRAGRLLKLSVTRYVANHQGYDGGMLCVSDFDYIIQQECSDLKVCVCRMSFDSPLIFR